MSSNVTVLVVDDDPTIRRVVRTVLEAADFDVVEAADGQSALGLIADSRGVGPTLAILDVMMPRMTGVELLQKMDVTDTRVVMLTAVDDPKTRAECEAAGASAFLTKPFSSLELLDVVESLL